ncbi:MAG: general stress protein [Bacteroidia bacterium]
MRSLIGIYDSHQEALDAIKELKKDNFPVEQLSLVSKNELTIDHIHIRDNRPIESLGLGVGMLVGPIVGVLTGIGVFSIPGLGFLYGTGAIAGALAGLDFGIMGGGLVSIFTALGIKGEYSVKHEEHLKEGKTLLIAEGTEEEVEHARTFLNENVLV